MTDHASESARLLQRADYIANADRWGDDRLDAASFLAGLALVHAVLAVNDRLAEIAGINEDRGRCS